MGRVMEKTVPDPLSDPPFLTPLVFQSDPTATATNRM